MLVLCIVRRSFAYEALNAFTCCYLLEFGVPLANFAAKLVDRFDNLFVHPYFFKATCSLRLLYNDFSDTRTWWYMVRRHWQNAEKVWKSYVPVPIARTLYVRGKFRSQTSCLCIFLFVCLCIHYLSVYLSICLSVNLFVDLPVYLSICLSVYLSIYLSLNLSVDLSVYPSIYLTNYLSTIFLPTYLPTYLSIYPSIYLSTIYLSIHPCTESIYLFTCLAINIRLSLSIFFYLPLSIYQ